MYKTLLICPRGFVFSIAVISLLVNINVFAGNIFDAIKKGDLEEVKRLIEQEGVDVNQVDSDGSTPLFIACYNCKNELEMVKLLLPHCTKDTINKANKNGQTPFFICCCDGRVEIAKLLLSHCTKETMHKADYNGETLLHRACKTRSIEAVKLLLPHYTKENINKTDKWGCTPLHSACESNKIEIVKLLLENGAKETVNKVDNNGCTPLSKVCGDIEIVKLLLPHCTEETINKADNNGCTPLSKICGDIEIVKLLLPHCKKETINKADKDGETALYKACSSKENNIEIIKLLLPHCTKETINKASEDEGLFSSGKGTTPLYKACENNNIELVKLLLPHCTKETINKQESEGGETPLHRAGYQKNMKIVKLLLKCKDIDVNKADTGGQTLPYWACAVGNIEMTRLLLPHCTKATINKVDEDKFLKGKTLLHKACMGEEKEETIKKVKLLLKHKDIDVNTVDKGGGTPLLAACSSRNLKIVKLLLPYCTKETINKADKSGWTPLYLTCEKDDTKIAKLLLKYGAQDSVNKTYKWTQETPFYWACRHNNKKIITLLLKCKDIVVNKTDKKGKTPLDFVVCYDNDIKIVKPLLQRGANYKQLMSIGFFANDVNLKPLLDKGSELCGYIDNPQKEVNKEDIKKIKKLILDKKAPMYDKQSGILYLANIRKKSKSLVSVKDLSALCTQIIFNYRIFKEQAFERFILFAEKNNFKDKNNRSMLESVIVFCDDENLRNKVITTLFSECGDLYNVSGLCKVWLQREEWINNSTVKRFFYDTSDWLKERLQKDGNNGQEHYNKALDWAKQHCNKKAFRELVNVSIYLDMLRKIPIDSAKKKKLPRELVAKIISFAGIKDLGAKKVL